MADTFFGETLVLLEKIGVYDVVLPFILVFTIVYAILEKTQVFGTEKDEKGNTLPRRNLNSMAAFVIGFIVVASANLVATISEVVANLVLLLVLAVSFLLLVGSFTNPENIEKGMYFGENSKTRTTLMVVMFIGIALIFLDALKVHNASDLCIDGSSCSWLEVIWGGLASYGGDGTAITAIALLIAMVLFVGWISGWGGGSKSTNEESEESENSNGNN